MATVSVRYIVNNVDEAISFYTDKLGFTLEMNPAPTFAMLDKGDLRLLLNAPSEQEGGGQTLKNGRKPESDVWNHISLQVSDLDSMIENLRRKGTNFRSDIVYGIGGNQVLIEDPSGNPIELFQPLQQS